MMRFLCFLFCIFSNNLMAETVLAMFTYVTADYTPSVSSSPSASCANYASSKGFTSPNYVSSGLTITSMSTQVGTCYYVNAGYNQSREVMIYQATCSSSYTLSGVYCTRSDCDTGQTRNDQGVCLTNCPAAGTVASTGLYDWGSLYGDQKYAVTCKDGCIVAFDGDAQNRLFVQNGKNHYYSTGSYIYMGPDMTCTAGPETVVTPNVTTTPPQQTCGLNQVAITSVTGKLNCYNDMTAGSGVAGTKVNTQSAEDQAKQQTDFEQMISAAATKAGEAAAAAVAAQGGDAAAQQQARQQAATQAAVLAAQQFDNPQSSPHCQRNPDDPLCKAGELDTSDLNKESTQQAIADSLSKIASAVEQTEVIDPEDEGIEESTIDLSSALSSVSFAGNASCPADRVLSLGGSTVTFSYAQLCDMFGALKLIVLACCAMVAFYILMGRQTAE